MRAGSGSRWEDFLLPSHSWECRGRGSPPSRNAPSSYRRSRRPQPGASTDPRAEKLRSARRRQTAVEPAVEGGRCDDRAAIMRVRSCATTPATSAERAARRRPGVARRATSAAARREIAICASVGPSDGATGRPSVVDGVLDLVRPWSLFEEHRRRRGCEAHRGDRPSRRRRAGAIRGGERRGPAIRAVWAASGARCRTRGRAPSAEAGPARARRPSRAAERTRSAERQHASRRTDTVLWWVWVRGRRPDSATAARDRRARAAGERCAPVEPGASPATPTALRRSDVRRR